MKVFVTDWDYPDLALEREVMARAGLHLVPVQCRTEDEVIGRCTEKACPAAGSSPATAWGWTMWT